MSSSLFASHSTRWTALARPMAHPAWSRWAVRTLWMWCLCSATGSGTAMAAGEAGVIVRLEPGGQAIGEAPEIRLTPVSGEAALVAKLNDDGLPPDVAADDGRWAGVAMTTLNSFQVAVTVGGETIEGGVVSWPDDKPARDLVVTLGWDGVTLQAIGSEQPSGADGTAGDGPGGALSEPAVGDARPGDGAPGGLGPGGEAGMLPPVPMDPSNRAAAPASPSSATAGSVPWAWAVLGISVLALTGLFVLRGGERSSGSANTDLERAPEPPIFGPGSPAVHTGVSIWHVQWSDRDAFLHGLVASLAEYHRVLLVGAGSNPAPMVGGPVYVSSETNLRLLRSTVDALRAQPGPRVVVVLVDPDPSLARVRALEGLLTQGLGGLIVTAQPPDGAPEPYVVDVYEGGATVTHSGHTLPLKHTRLGYVPQA